MQQSGIDAMQQSGKSAVQCVCLDNTRPDPESEEAEKWLSGVRTGKDRIQTLPFAAVVCGPSCFFTVAAVWGSRAAHWGSWAASCWLAAAGHKLRRRRQGSVADGIQATLWQSTWELLSPPLTNWPVAGLASYCPVEPE